jgi:hypothetical protein
MVWDCLIVELLWLHHIQSLASVTMATIAIAKVSKLIHSRTSCSNEFGIEEFCVLV